MFLSEMGPPQYRGALNNMFQLATSCGILLAQLINFGVKDIGPYKWRVSLAIAGALPSSLWHAGTPARTQQCNCASRVGCSSSLPRSEDADTTSRRQLGCFYVQ